MRPAAGQPLPFQVMIKPHGPACNLACRYCYYLDKAGLYPDGDQRMSDELLAEFTRQYVAAQTGPEVTFAWQGGEPTLLGLEFFRRAVALQRRHARPGLRVTNALQTNGLLLDDEWCAWLRQNDFLVGISLDGPAGCHDAYRVDRGGGPTFGRVMAGLGRLKKHGVQYNVLTAVHTANVGRPAEVYRFLRDEVGARFVQFIPIVEWDRTGGRPKGQRLTDRSVTGQAYGEFLIGVFDEWVRHDVGRTYVQIFDVALGTWLGRPPGLCVFQETCGQGLVLEHNGDLYPCDHFVDSHTRLGNITARPLAEMARSRRQQRFGLAKRETLPRACRVCAVRWACHGECPKNRYAAGGEGRPGLSALCAGYKAFFTHIGPAMQFMAAAIRAGRAPAEIMAHLARSRA